MFHVLKSRLLVLSKNIFLHFDENVHKYILDCNYFFKLYLFMQINLEYSKTIIISKNRNALLF